MPGDQYPFRIHFVAFLDVLGQGDLLDGLKVPATPEERAQCIGLLQKTAGAVLALRRNFQKQFEAYVDTPKPNFWAWSDSMVTFLAMENGVKSQLQQIHRALVAVSTVVLTALANGIPVRGGIDIGAGLELSEKEIYSAGLRSAYLLESKRAQYPRVVIGSRAHQYVKAIGTETDHDQTTKKLIGQIKGLIWSETDGAKILDYIGPEMVELAGAEKETHSQNLVKPAYDFIREEQEKVSDDPILGPRYVRLRSYLSLACIYGISQLRWIIKCRTNSN
jgi:hypothetical protein